MKKLLVLGLVVFAFSGCVAPALLGIKSYETAESRTEFITGADFGISFSGTDTLDNRKGINPKNAGLKARKGE